MASTYLLALIVAVLLLLIFGLLAYVSSHQKGSLKSGTLFLYNYFLGGMAFAAVVSSQGAFMNLTNDISINFGFYLLGLVLVFILLGEGIWSVCKEKANIYKIRVLVKALILSVLHYNPLYLFSLVLGTEVFFMAL